MQAAFVDLGLEKSAFLHASDLTPDTDLEDLFEEEEDGDDNPEPRFFASHSANNELRQIGDWNQRFQNAIQTIRGAPSILGSVTVRPSLR